MADRFTLGAVWMRSVALTVGYDGPLSMALGYAYSLARLRPRVYAQHEGGTLDFAGLAFHETMNGNVQVCGRVCTVHHYRREVIGAFSNRRLHEQLHALAAEVLDDVDVDRLDTTDAAWRAFDASKGTHGLRVFVGACKVLRRKHRRRAG